MIDCKLINYKHGKFNGIESVKQYVTARYPRWEDYSKYHCSHAGIEDEATDVLNEVVLSLLEKEIDVVERLYSTRQGQYTQLDFYVLQMLKLNVHSATSPYQCKYKRIPVNREVHLERLKIIDEPYEEIDKPGIILKQMRLVRWVFNGLQLDPLERKVFQWKFFDNNSFSEWPGPESVRMLYPRYNFVEATIHTVLYRLELTRLKPLDLQKRLGTNIQVDLVFELADNFIKHRKISINAHN